VILIPGRDKNRSRFQPVGGDQCRWAIIAARRLFYNHPQGFGKTFILPNFRYRPAIYLLGLLKN